MKLSQYKWYDDVLYGFLMERDVINVLKNRKKSIDNIYIRMRFISEIKMEKYLPIDIVLTILSYLFPDQAPIMYVEFDRKQNKWVTGKDVREYWGI